VKELPMTAHQHTPCAQRPPDRNGDLRPNATMAGKEAAFLLLRRFADRFRAIVRRVLASRLRSLFDPDDVLQEIAIILLIKPLPGWINTAKDFVRYVGGIAKNIALGQNRRHLD